MKAEVMRLLEVRKDYLFRAARKCEQGDTVEEGKAQRQAEDVARQLQWFSAKEFVHRDGLMVLRGWQVQTIYSKPQVGPGVFVALAGAFQRGEVVVRSLFHKLAVAQPADEAQAA